MKYSESNKPIVCMMTQSTCYKGTEEMIPLGVLWHSTGANNPTLKRYVQPDDNAPNHDELVALIGKNSYGNDWNHINRQAGLNAWVGKLANGKIASIQTMPWNYKPWGCGSGSKGSCNNGWMQFEICEDGLNDKSYFDAIYEESCELTAYYCKMYDLNPKGTVKYNGIDVPVILDHTTSCKLGLGSNHGDVQHWFKKYNKTMDDVRNDVAKLMSSVDVSTPAPTPGGMQAIDFKDLDNAKVIEKVGPLFTADQKKNGILASISLAQFILESGYGKSELAQNANNMFGMKCGLSGNTWAGSTWDGSKYTKQTQEYVNGEYITVYADFRKYACVEDSIADHSAYLLGAKRDEALRYEGIKGETDYKIAAQIIKDGGYATSPTYVDSICSIIERWNLTKYDIKDELPDAADINFKEGDRVKLTSDARYTSGKTIPDWVFDRVLYVRAVNGNNITISTLKTGAVTGVVASKYLRLESSDSNDDVQVEEPNETEFKVGAKVRLRGGARYTSGRAIPDWVFDKVLYIRELRENDSCIISTQATGAVTGVVYLKDLVLEGAADSAFVSYLVRIIYDTLDVYSEPTLNSKIKLQVKKNGVYTIVEEKGNWGKLKSGAGWIHLNGTKKN